MAFFINVKYILSKNLVGKLPFNLHSVVKQKMEAYQTFKFQNQIIIFCVFIHENILEYSFFGQ